VSDASWVLTAAVVLALAVMGVSLLSARRSEVASQQAKAAARNAGHAANQARVASQQTEGMVAAFREGRPADVDSRPTCPYDGEPLTGYVHEAGRPSRFRHADGVEHDDFTAHMVVQNMPPQSSPFPPVPPVVSEPVPVQAQPVQSTAVDTYFQRVSNAEGAGLINVDSLRAGVGDITRNPEFAEAMQDIAERTRRAEQSEAPRPSPRMPDPTRAGRVTRARRQPPPSAPPSTNGDGS
jgi:hypothetical protein